MHRDHYGLDDHLRERVLGNIWSVLEPLGSTLKGSKMFKMVFGYIRKHRSVDRREKGRGYKYPSIVLTVGESLTSAKAGLKAGKSRSGGIPAISGQMSEQIAALQS
jgi:hypothetical protein